MAKAKKIELCTPGAMKGYLEGHGYLYVKWVDAINSATMRGSKAAATRLEKQEAHIISIYTAALARIAELESQIAQQGE